MRLFVALPFSEEAKDRLTDAERDLMTQSRSAGLTKRENLHLTLAFIGETNDHRRAVRALSQIDHAAFSMTLKGSGRFGDLYWVGVEKNEALLALMKKTQTALREAGFAIEKRENIPHVTIARRVEADRPPKIAFDAVTFSCTAFHLMVSERIGGKLCYRSLYRKELLPHADAT